MSSDLVFDRVKGGDWNAAIENALSATRKQFEHDHFAAWKYRQQQLSKEDSSDDEDDDGIYAGCNLREAITPSTYTGIAPNDPVLNFISELPTFSPLFLGFLIPNKPDLCKCPSHKWLIDEKQFEDDHDCSKSKQIKGSPQSIMDHLRTVKDMGGNNLYHKYAYVFLQHLFVQK